MSYIKVYLPELPQLKERIESDRDKWIRFYAKHGAVVGSTESVEYLDKKLKEYYDSKENK